MKFEIACNGEGIKTISAKGMNSIYAQYKKWCAAKFATHFVECPEAESVGCGYWSNYTEDFLLREANE
jgi:hypothetical protein